MKKYFPVLAVFASVILLFAVGFDSVSFPERFPAEWKAKKLRSTRTVNLSPGVDYYHYHFDDFFGNNTPLSFHTIVIDWDKANVKFNLAECGDTLKTVEEMVKEKNPLFAINGAYFTYKPPVTYFRLKINGTVYEPGEKGEKYASAFAFSGSEFPVIIQKMSDENFEKYENVMQGYQMGKDGVDLYADRDRTKDKNDTPYTVIGINKAERKVILFVCDGRFPDDSVGVAFHGVADFLFALGAEDVISIDGGGSSTVLLDNKGKLDLVNYPSDNKKFDHEGARKVQNCIYVTKN